MSRRGLSRVLARAPARSAVVRDPDRDRSRRDAGASSTTLPHVGGARVPGVPRRRRRPRQGGRRSRRADGYRRPARSACSPSRPECSSCPARSRTSPRSRSAVAATIAVMLLPVGARVGARRRTGRRRPRRARHVRRGDAPAAMASARGSLGSRQRDALPVRSRARDRDRRALRRRLHARAAASEVRAGHRCDGDRLHGRSSSARPQWSRPRRRTARSSATSSIHAARSSSPSSPTRSEEYRARVQYVALRARGRTRPLAFSFPGLTGTTAYFFDGHAVRVLARRLPDWA